MNKNLTFKTFRRANLLRLPKFKNFKGELAHSKEDGSDWSIYQWVCATLGELGEFANIVKKVGRGDLTLDEARPLLKKEGADVITYMDLTLAQLGIDMEEAVRDKFNEISDRVNVPIKIENNEVIYNGNIVIN